LFAGVTCFAIWIPAQSYGVLILFAILHGTCSGCFWSMSSPVMAEIIGLKHLASAQSIAWLAVVGPCTFAEAIALSLVSLSQAHGESGSTSYRGTIIFSGGTMILAGLSLLGAKFWKQREKQEKGVLDHWSRLFVKT